MNLSLAHQSLLVEAGFAQAEVAEMVYCPCQEPSEESIAHYSRNGQPLCGECWESIPTWLG